MKKDNPTKKYLKNNDAFADAVNYALFNGKRVVKPKDLYELDTSEITIQDTKAKKTISIQKFRDILKLCEIKRTDDVAYLILGIENQSEIHYAMPIKNMLYDAINYSNQLEEIKKKHKEKGDLKGSELLSGIKKDEKLIPIITIVVLWNDQQWDGPRRLIDMLDIKDKRLLKYINDYKLNLIVPAEIKDFSKFKSDFRYILNFVKEKNNRLGLKEFVESNPDFFSNLDSETAYLLKEVGSMKQRLKKNKEGGYNMCLAFEEERKIGEKLGIEKGEKRGEERMARLTQKLLMEKKIDELQKAISDTAFRELLYMEYHI